MRLILIVILVASAMLAGCGPKPQQWRTVDSQPAYTGPVPPQYDQPSALADGSGRDLDGPVIVTPLPPSYGTSDGDGSAISQSLGVTTAEQRRLQLRNIESRGGVVSPDPVRPIARAAPIPSGGVIEHTVTRGDTLWGLAQKYLGAGRRWTEIQSLNPAIDPAKLMPGQTLLIPAN